MTTESEGELAVVVLALGEVPALPRALASLAEQPETLEVVVVHSAVPPHEAQPATPSGGVRHLRFTERLITGAARNRGVAATRAPWVAFLSFDCLARPGWAEGRLRAHRAGAEVVAAALVNPHPRSPSAWAAYIALHHRRWPGVPEGEALHYGASYSRAALAAAGGFDERLAVGEDTDLNRRLRAIGISSRWCPEVLATHPYPTHLGSFLGEQFERGQRAARSWLLQDRADLARQLGGAGHRRGWEALRFAARFARRGERKWILLAAPLVLVGARRYSAGARGELRVAGILAARD